MKASSRPGAIVAAVALLAVAASVVALLLHGRAAALSGAVGDLHLTDVWLGLLLPPVGAWLVTRRRLGAVGGVLLLQGFVALAGLAGQVARYAQLTDGPASVVGVGSWVAGWAWAPYLLLTTLVLWTPRERTTTRAEGILGHAVVGLVAVVAVVLMVAPGPVQGVPGLVNPIGLTGMPGLTPLAGLLIAVVAVGGTAAATATLIVRLVRSRGDQRARLAWTLPAQVLVLGAVLFSGDLPYPWNDVVTAAALTGLVAALIVVDSVGAALDDRDAGRRALVVAREAERARLRRDLHDGLGPEMAGLSLQLSVAAGKADDPEVRAVLSSVQERLRVTTTQVRHLVDGLRPPALDELGLTGAVRQLVTRQAGAFPDGVTVAGDEAAAFPPEVEVAAHHIIAEAFTNAARHSGARRCDIRIVGDGGVLQMQVADDGPARSWSRDGIGLESMRVRAREVGGHVRIVRRTDGTTVHATLPLDGEASG